MIRNTWQHDIPANKIILLHCLPNDPLRHFIKATLITDIKCIYFLIFYQHGHFAFQVCFHPCGRVPMAEKSAYHIRTSLFDQYAVNIWLQFIIE